MHLPQLLFDQILKNSNKTFKEKLFKHIQLKIRNLLIKCFNDPLVEYDLENTFIKIPLSHELPLYKKDSPQYSSNIGRISLKILNKYPNLTCIDIGANVGDTACILRNFAYFPILCIEGNSKFSTILKINIKNLSDVYLEEVFISTQTGFQKGRLNTSRGTASFINDTNSEDAIQTKTLSEVLEKHPEFKSSKLLKIDTDGMDVLILKSEIHFLKNSYPIIFFEYDPHFYSEVPNNGFDIFETLQLNGYEKVIIYENNGDYLLTTDLTNLSTLYEIHNYYSGRKGNKYCDICVFPYEDKDLFDEIRSSEQVFFKEFRK